MEHDMVRLCKPKQNNIKWTDQNYVQLINKINLILHI